MREIFEKIPNAQLKGTLIWEPMLSADNLASASIQQDLFQDERVQHYWDAENILGKKVAEPLLKNTPIAWDIYMIYQSGAKWDTEKFPAPDFWMHQLEEDESLRLNPEILEQQVISAINNLSDQQT